MKRSVRQARHSDVSQRIEEYRGTICLEARTREVPRRAGRCDRHRGDRCVRRLACAELVGEGRGVQRRDHVGDRLPGEDARSGTRVRRRWQQLHGVPGVRRHASLREQPQAPARGRELVEADEPDQVRLHDSLGRQVLGRQPRHSGGRGLLDQPGPGQEARVSAREPGGCRVDQEGGRLRPATRSR